MTLYERMPLKLGKTKMMKRFAWLPTTLSNGDVVWLERLVVVRRVSSLGHWVGWCDIVVRKDSREARRHSETVYRDRSDRDDSNWLNKTHWET